MKHTHEVVFGRKVAGCPRCDALLAGAPVTKGWGHAKRASDMMRSASIKAHNCVTSKCGPVCTHGDW